MSLETIPLLALGLAILVQTAVVAFFGGKMSQRMTSAERKLSEQGLEIEKKMGDHSALVEKVVRLQVQMEHVGEKMDKAAHTIENMSHQLSNLAMGRAGKLYEIGVEG